jgi:hypothetical protein
MSQEAVAQAILQLDQHCIETTARHRHQRLMSQLLEADQEDPALASQLEVLRAFLEQTDFAAIRAAHPDLCGGTRMRVRITLDRDGRARWSKIGKA